jgi:hypothetical protein
VIIVFRYEDQIDLIDNVGISQLDSSPIPLMGETLIVPVSTTIGRTIRGYRDIKHGGRYPVIGADPRPRPAFHHPISDHYLGGDVGVMSYEKDHRQFIVWNTPFMNHNHFPLRIPEKIADGKIKTGGSDTYAEVNLGQ